MVRRGHPPEAGRWTLPGGRVEPGESVALAVERELPRGDRSRRPVRAVRRMGGTIPGRDHFVILDFDSLLPGAIRTRRPAATRPKRPGFRSTRSVALTLVSGLEDFLGRHRVLR